jgi:hypothetical protein
MSREKGTRLLVAAVMTIDTLRRFFGDFRPADLTICILEIIFIAVILWLDLPERFHKNKVRRRLVLVQRIMLDGHNLRTSVSDANANNETASKWIQSVQIWIDNSYQSLADNSLQAGLAFMHRHVAPDVLYWGVTIREDVSKQFQELLIRLNNLLNIMEKADVYF